MPRWFLASLMALSMLLVSSAVWSGSYLNRAAVLLNASRTERDMVMPRSNDKELVRVVHQIAAARVVAANDMQVPKIVAGAHPHLMLVLESSERAYAAALVGDQQKFLSYILRARAEDKSFRSIIDKLGYSVPGS